MNINKRKKKKKERKKERKKRSSCYNISIPPFDVNVN